MAKSLAEKLRIKETMHLLTINAPANFLHSFKEVRVTASTTTKQNKYQQIHWFVQRKAQMEKDLNKVMKLMQPGIICWIYYPKGSSKLQTDLTRDKGWYALLKHDEMQWISLISFDNTWSAFGMRLKSEADKKKVILPKIREIFNWVNPTTKEVRLPEDLFEALKKCETEAKFFNGLSFTNKKEYIEWIVTARREETRMERVKGTIERLSKEWKNPRNI